MSLKGELEKKNLSRKVLQPLGISQTEAVQMAVAGLNINVASVALGLEAIEELLVAKGVFQKDELMVKVSELARSKVNNPILGPSDD